MNDYRSDWPKRVGEHHKRIDIAQYQLLNVARLLCPDNWVLEIIPQGRKEKEVFYSAAVSNGDDNVTGQGKTIAAALAQMIHYLLNGSVFPLGGRNYGSYCPFMDEEVSGEKVDGNA